MKRRFISTLLAICLALSLLPRVAWAENQTASASGDCGDKLTWELLTDGTLIISGKGAMYDFTINYSNHEPAGGTPWISYRNKIKKVVLKDGITYVGASAFSYCNQLSEVIIPHSVTALGTRAFSQCPNLKSVNMPNSITNIGPCLFLTSGLETIELPDSLTYISEAMFEDCRSLKNVTIPPSITRIEESAFNHCTGLINVRLPDSVTYIGSGAFGCCWNLKTINIPDSVTFIGGGAFASCFNLNELHIPSSVVNIGGSVFSDYGITSIIIPKGISSIDGLMFSGCTSLTSVVLPEGATEIAPQAFEGCINLTSIVIPDSLNNTMTSAGGGHNIFNHSPKLTSAGPIGGNYNIQFGWRDAIPDNGFFSMENLTNVVLPDSITSIGAWSFAYCQALKNIDIPEGVTDIGTYAFSHCKELTQVTLPDSITEIGLYAFYGSGLTSITIPKNVTGICPAIGTFGTNPDLVIRCFKDSDAHKYAVSCQIKYILLDEDDPSIQSVTMFRNSIAVNLLTEAVKFEQDTAENVEISIEADWGSVEGGRVFLLQDRDTYIELTSQTASFAPSSIFAPDKQIYVAATNAAADTLLDWKEVKLQIVQTTPPDTPQISISPEPLDLSIGKTGEITVITTPAGARYTLTSSDPEVVSVSGNTLTAHKLGRVEITAALVDYPNVQAVCSVAVKEGYDDLMCAIAACQLSYEDELIRYGFGATVNTFTDAAIGPNRQFWSGYTEAVLSDFYKDVLGDWKILAVSSYSSGLFAAALYNEERNLEIIAFRGTEIQHPNDVIADLQFAVLNQLPEQFHDAMDFYDRCAGSSQQILLTGHSLGGAAACYVSLMTGARAELFNGANGLIIEDAYFVGGEGIYQNFHGADRWNFVNHVTDCAPVSVNHPIAYPNADNLPVEVHAFSSTILSGSPNGLDGHSLCSILEYDQSVGRFWLTQSVPYSQNLSGVRQFEMTRVDGLAFIEKALNFTKKPLWLDALLLALQQYEMLTNQDHLKVRFSFGSSGDDNIVDKNLIEQVFLFGGDGNDFLTGGCINDVLAGGLGVNAMDGGPMNDLYIITGTDNQYINDCSGVDDIYIPSRVRVRSFGNPTDKVDGYYVLTLTNGQQVMLNKDRKQDYNTRFRVYSIDGTFCGSYRTVPQEPETQIVTLAIEDGSPDTLPVTTLEFSGHNLVLEVQDDAGNPVGTVSTVSDTFPRYESYGYFYFDDQEDVLWAHLFGGSGEVTVSSTSPAAQTISCSSIFHNTDDDLPLKRFTAEIDLQSSDAILTPACSSQEPDVPFKLKDSNGNTQEIPAKTEDLTVSKDPDDPVPSAKYYITFNSQGGSAVSSISVSSGGKVTKPAAPTRSGYNFSGWYKESSCTNAWDFDVDTVTGDTTLYAKWTHQGSSGEVDPTPELYQVVFDSQGGSAVSSISVSSGGKVTKPAAPTRSGYNFGGWYKESSCMNAWNFDADVVTGNITLYAKWTYRGSGNSDSWHSGGGGGSSSNGTYAISVPSRTIGGTVKVSPTSAKQGSTVTVTVTPDAGYKLDILTVTDASGNVLTLTKKSDTQYTFTMPGRAVTVTATFALLPDNAEIPCDGGADCPSHCFTDLDSIGTWYHEAVDYVLRNGLMGGYGDARFGPDNYLTRTQLAQILFNKEGRTAVNYPMNFSDVTSEAWYTEAIRWATSQGIVGGYGNGTFGPNDNITREQLAVMLWRYSGSPAATNKKLHFSDAGEASGYALDALRWAVENEIINGEGSGILDPKGLATRAQVAQILKNYLER